LATRFSEKFGVGPPGARAGAAEPRTYDITAATMTLAQSASAYQLNDRQFVGLFGGFMFAFARA